MNRDPELPKTRKTLTAQTVTPSPYDPDSNTTIYEASHGDYAGMFTHKMDQCWACNTDYPVEEMTYWRGKAYCPECKSDIIRHIRNERGSRIETRGTEKVITFEGQV